MAIFIALISAFFISGIVPSYGQKHIEGLTGKGRPVISNPDAFVSALKTKANNLVVSRIGREAFERLADTTYEYPWYYHNVYFNSAPSEMNYRVAFWFNRGKQSSFSFELVFSSDSLIPVFPMDQFLPDCAINPSLCHLIDSNRALKIAVASLPVKFNQSGEVNLGYDAERQCFVWYFWVSEMLEYPYGRTALVWIEAHSGNILKNEFEGKVWMGRCLPPESMIDTPTGQKPVFQLTTGDSVLYRNRADECRIYTIVKTSKQQVKQTYSMIKISLADGRSLLVSGSHPTTVNGKVFGQIRTGDEMDGTIVRKINWIPYSGTFTYDILSSETEGRYMVNGIPAGSSLFNDDSSSK